MAPPSRLPATASTGTNGTLALYEACTLPETHGSTDHAECSRSESSLCLERHGSRLCETPSFPPPRPHRFPGRTLFNVHKAEPQCQLRNAAETAF